MGNFLKVFFPSVNLNNLAKFVQNFLKCFISQFKEKKPWFHDGNEDSFLTYSISTNVYAMDEKDMVDKVWLLYIANAINE